MATNYDAVDFSFSWNGDYNLEGGDLKDTSADQIQTLLQTIHSTIASSKGDWELNPGNGAGLSDFVGEPNSKATAQLINTRISSSLPSIGINSSDLVIKIVPVGIHQLLLILAINARATEKNSLLKDGLITSLVFDTIENQVSFLEDR